MNTFIDTHSHIDMEEFQENFSEMLDKCKEVGVEKVIIPGVNVEDTKRIIDLIDKYDNLYALVGLHPEEASKWNDESLDYFREVSKHKKVLGIGEIGLDYYWDKGNIELQREVLIKQIELAKEINKPIVIHDRDAHMDTMRILKETNAKEVGVVLHCFSGSVEFLNECINEGFYISLGGVVTFKNAHKPKEIAKAVPLDRLFLETDAPYMTPVPYRGTTNYPYYIPLIAQQIAELRGITVEEVAKVTTENALRFFNIL
ncbi:MAG: TatD family hydrolase [Candidatus Gastranaerophilales bacterium]|nr:TatD family hydrolase [Candidatus Gastranaerophilales bacterium]